jgi:chromosome condensin MukBEF MukE localization factor
VECQKIIDKMWSPVAAEDLVNRLLPALDAALRADGRVVLLSDAVRTQRFADRFRREVLVPGE